MCARMQIWRRRPQLQPFTRASKQYAGSVDDDEIRAAFLEELSISGYEAL